MMDYNLDRDEKEGVLCMQAAWGADSFLLQVAYE